MGMPFDVAMGKMLHEHKFIRRPGWLYGAVIYCQENIDGVPVLYMSDDVYDSRLYSIGTSDVFATDWEVVEP